jgi:hypothetical protein
VLRFGKGFDVLEMPLVWLSYLKVEGVAEGMADNIVSGNGPTSSW